MAFFKPLNFLNFFETPIYINSCLNLSSAIALINEGALLARSPLRGAGARMFFREAYAGLPRHETPQCYGPTHGRSTGSQEVLLPRRPAGFWVPRVYSQTMPLGPYC